MIISWYYTHIGNSKGRILFQKAYMEEVLTKSLKQKHLVYLQIALERHKADSGTALQREVHWWSLRQRCGTTKGPQNLGDGSSTCQSLSMVAANAAAGSAWGAGCSKQASSFNCIAVDIYRGASWGPPTVIVLFRQRRSIANRSKCQSQWLRVGMTLPDSTDTLAGHDSGEHRQGPTAITSRAPSPSRRWTAAVTRQQTVFWPHSTWTSSLS